jgi:hypothetical protein
VSVQHPGLEYKNQPDHEGDRPRPSWSPSALALAIALGPRGRPRPSPWRSPSALVVALGALVVALGPRPGDRPRPSWSPSARVIHRLSTGGALSTGLSTAFHSFPQVIHRTAPLIHSLSTSYPQNRPSYPQASRVIHRPPRLIHSFPQPVDNLWITTASNIRSPEHLFVNSGNWNWAGAPPTLGRIECDRILPRRIAQTNSNSAGVPPSPRRIECDRRLPRRIGILNHPSTHHNSNSAGEHPFPKGIESDRILPRHPTETIPIRPIPIMRPVRIWRSQIRTGPIPGPELEFGLSADLNSN